MSMATRYRGTNVNVLSPTGVGETDLLSNQSQLTGFDVNVVHSLATTDQLGDCAYVALRSQESELVTRAQIAIGDNPHRYRRHGGHRIDGFDANVGAHESAGGHANLRIRILR
jgi:hypothetical protein